MAIVEIAIIERIANAPAGIVLVCNNPTDTLRFTFDDEWASQTAKVARFEWGGHYIDVPFSGNEVKVPEITNTLYVNVGVYGDDIASTHVKLQCKRSILCLGDNERVPMDNTNYDEFKALVDEFNQHANNMEEATALAQSATVAANNAAKAADQASENIGAVVESVSDKANAFKQSVEGNPSTFYPDEASLLKPIITLEPIQPGNGDPCPPGAINLINEATLVNTSNANNYCAWENGRLHYKNSTGTTFEVNCTFVVATAGTYYFGGSVELVSGTATGGIKIGDETVVWGFNKTYTIAAGTEVKVRLTTSNLKDIGEYYGNVWLVKSNVAVEYTPYENIRPISGRTAVSLTRCGKNLLAPLRTWSGTYTHNGITFTENEDGSIHVSGTTGDSNAWASVSIKGARLKDGAKYICSMSGQVNCGADIGYFVNDDDSNNTYTKYTTLNAGRPSWVIDGNDKLVRAYVTVGAGMTVDETVKIQLEVGETATDYEPYQGDNFSVNFGQTVYGGTLDWNTGKLVIDRKIRSLTGEEAWVYLSDATYPYWFYSIDTLNSVVNSADDKCSHFTRVIINGNTNNTGFAVYNTSTGSYARLGIRPNIDGVNDVDTFKAYLANHYAAGTPVQVCYKITSPTVIQLTTAQILALAGMNTVYSDGDGMIMNYNKSLLKVIEELTNAIISLGGNV